MGVLSGKERCQRSAFPYENYGGGSIPAASTIAMPDEPPRLDRGCRPGAPFSQGLEAGTTFTERPLVARSGRLLRQVAHSLRFA
jgi:hypothetical protein